MQVLGVWRTPDGQWRVELVDDRGPAYRVWYLGGVVTVMPPQPARLAELMRLMGGRFDELVED